MTACSWAKLSVFVGGTLCASGLIGLCLLKPDQAKCVAKCVAKWGANALMKLADMAASSRAEALTNIAAAAAN